MAAPDVSQSLLVNSVRKDYTDIQSALSNRIETQDLPSFVASQQAWVPAGFEDERSYIVYLSEDDKVELDTSLAFFKSETATLFLAV